MFKNPPSLGNIEGLDQQFLRYLHDQDPSIYAEYLSHRSSKGQNNQLLIEISYHLDDFLAVYFDIENEVMLSRSRHKDFDSIYECKRKFIQRIALKKYPYEKLSALNFKEITSSLNYYFNDSFITIKALADQILLWMTDSAKYEIELDLAAKYCSYMVHNNSRAVLFDVPRKMDPLNLISQLKISRIQEDLNLSFDFKSPELTAENSMNHAHYCIYCHNQDKDSCSKGFKDQPELSGCPLKQKISEMNYVKAKGFDLAALAIIMVDNPMVAVTGHRICNDCMKSCIFQKQDPVAVPIVESEILNAVLNLPYGVEIYDLLTRWNPLNFNNPLPAKLTGKNALIVGLGPAGFALAHYLTNEGHNVVAIEGLKMNPLNFNIDETIKHWSDFKKLLSERLPMGFGGVAEYGITTRWDKNYLTLIHIILERRSNFKAFDSVFLGGNITIDQAFEVAGFNHVAICTGASKPKMLDIPGAYSKGVRIAADFLMNLQAGGAFLANSNANLMIRMPVAVIGAGLTAVDAAVEALKYYPEQVKKFARNYKLLNNLSKEEQQITTEFLKDAKLFENAKNDHEIREILIRLGGATIYYRGRIENSPAYKLNHEELIQAFAAGVQFKENMNPLKINTDEFDNSCSISFEDNMECLAKTVLIAIGTERPVHKYDHPGITYLGDSNPAYAGSVVKALASAKNHYFQISSALNNASILENNIFEKMGFLLTSKIQKIRMLPSNITELTVHSPWAVENYRAGQFFRLQNYAEKAEQIIEPIALSVTAINKAKYLITFKIIGVGQSSKLCANFMEGERVSLMGPAGAPIKILKNKKILIIGSDHVADITMQTIADALKDNGCSVVRYFSENKENIESLINDNTEGFDQIICSGTTSLMEYILAIKHKFKKNPVLSCIINAPMQCMMKGICGQCVLPVNDERRYIFTCACQEQNAENINFKAVSDRLNQNSLFEKLALKRS